MAYQKKLDQWILSISNSMDLRITTLDWPGQYFPGLNDIEAAMVFHGSKFSGRGADQSPEIALYKAIVESIERIVCRNHMISTQGVAGHLSIEQAKDNAYLEFIERYAYGLHIQELRPFKPIISYQRKIFKTNGNVLNLNLHALKMISPENLNSIVFIAEGISTSESFGGVLGLACERDEQIAIKKASIECFRNLIPAINGIFDDNIFDDSVDNSPNFSGVKTLLDPNYCSNFLDQFIKKSNSKISGQFPKIYPEFTELNLPTELSDCPILFARCTDKFGTCIHNAELVG